MASQLVQRIVGLVFLLGGSAGGAWCWYTALNEGYFYKGPAALGPAFAVLGVGMLLFPIDKEELLKKHGVEKPERFSQYPPAWQGLIVVAATAGIGNFLALWLR